MTNHPNRSSRYRGVEIIRTNSVCLSQNNKHLYALTGAIEKSAEVGPFLTTVQAARDFIDGMIAVRENT